MSDNLVIASKVKKHLKEAHGMRSSEDTLDALSELIKTACAHAVQQAKADKRKTVQGKDFAGVRQYINPPSEG